MHGDFSRLPRGPIGAYTQVLKQQGRVELDSDWNEQGAIAEGLRRTALRDVVGESGAPKFHAGFRVLELPLSESPPTDFLLSAGRFYADGLMIDLENTIRYSNQAAPLLQPALDVAVGRTDLVYLEVWQRHVTALEDPDLREVALGGPDTTTRLATAWRVRVRPGVGDGFTCGDRPEGWPPTPTGSGLLTTSLAAEVDPGDPCLIAAEGGFRGLENRLYRVEIHTGGDVGAATFKWSRDNGAVVFAVDSFPAAHPDRVVLKRLGRDRTLTLRRGDWVEVLDDATEYFSSELGQAGTLARVEDLLDDRTIVLDRPLPADRYDAATRHARVRRWDQTDNLDPDGAVPTGAGPISLEDGIQVSFAAGSYRTGDFWTFRARTATGSIDILTNEPAQGVAHRYYSLAVIQWFQVGEQWSGEVTNCPPLFPPLTHICAGDVCYEGGCGVGGKTVEDALNALCGRRTLRLVSGDGQEAAPGTAVAGPLVVGVEDGVGRGAAGQAVQFKVEAGDGQIGLPGGPFSAGPVDAVTDANGLASCEWQLGPNPNELNLVSARLSAPPRDPALPVVFRAVSEVSAGGGGLCTVTLGVDGPDDLMQAVMSLPEGGGCVCVPPGLHKIPETLEFPKLANVTIKGCRGASVFVGSGEVEPIIRFIQSSGITFHDLAFRSVCLQFHNCKDVDVHDCDFLGRLDRLIYLTVDPNEEVSDVRIERNDFRYPEEVVAAPPQLPEVAANRPQEYRRLLVEGRRNKRDFVQAAVFLDDRGDGVREGAGRFVRVAIAGNSAVGCFMFLICRSAEQLVVRENEIRYPFGAIDLYSGIAADVLIADNLMDSGIDVRDVPAGGRVRIIGNTIKNSMFFDLAGDLEMINNTCVFDNEFSDSWNIFAFGSAITTGFVFEGNTFQRRIPNNQNPPRTSILLGSSSLDSRPRRVVFSNNVFETNMTIANPTPNRPMGTVELNARAVTAVGNHLIDAAEPNPEPLAIFSILLAGNADIPNSLSAVVCTNLTRLPIRYDNLNQPAFKFQSNARF
ncbi:MAG: DUF6519 domain-containing protein [Isosphaeraceae bacterium]